MSTDFQTARVALGARLRELRSEAGLNGKGVAEALGWQRSKVSRLETGKQTPTASDLLEWARAVGRPGVATELRGRLVGLESQYRSWRRQLAGGHRARQELAVTETMATQLIRGMEVSRIPGLFQTADYARHAFEANAEFRSIPRDVEAAVRARMRRQEALYEAGKHFRFVVWEAALYVLTCPREVMAAQLDRLIGLIGLDTVEIRVFPLGAQLKRAPGHGFWIYDRRRVIVETINTEMWLDDEENVVLRRARPLPASGLCLPVPCGGHRSPGGRMSVSLSAADVRTCEACWRSSVTAARHTARGRDLLCRACAESGRPRRVDVFPPYGIYRLHHRPANRSVSKSRGDGQ